jgi:hypothetical protein
MKKWNIIQLEYYLRKIELVGRWNEFKLGYVCGFDQEPAIHIYTQGLNMTNGRSERMFYKVESSRSRDEARVDSVTQCVILVLKSTVLCRFSRRETACSVRVAPLKPGDHLRLRAPAGGYPGCVSG